jgi:hypothetical protein
MRKRHTRAQDQRPAPDEDWVGGIVTIAASVTDRAEPYEPKMAVWVESESGAVVGHEMCHPDEVRGALAQALRTAIEQPHIGPPRTPARIRVADASLAAEARAIVDEDLPIVIAPTPELDWITDAFGEWISAETDRAATQPQRRAERRVGRNDSCPCGSGRKYKVCHMREDAERTEGGPSDEIHPLHERDDGLVQAICAFAASRLRDEWAGSQADFNDAVESDQLWVPWSVFHYLIAGRTVADRYLEECGSSLSRSTRTWFDAQRAAWLSVWEVVAVDPGVSLTLSDLLSGEVHTVRESSASRQLVLRDALLGRVVHHEGVSLLCGCYPRPLPPLAAAEVVRRARAKLRSRSAVSVARLRDERFGRYLIARWEDAVAELDHESAIPPKLHNTDGDPLLLTTDHFELAPGSAAAVEEALAAMEGAEGPDSDSDERACVFTRPGNRMSRGLENTIVGRAERQGDSLRVETNSTRRADALRKRIEKACGKRIKHARREQVDPLRAMSGVGERTDAPEPPPPDVQAALIEVKRRHFAAWPDEPLPVLAGLTARQAVRTARGRAAVEVLIKDMENREQRSAGEAPFDLTELREDLGLVARPLKPARRRRP